MTRTILTFLAACLLGLSAGCDNGAANKHAAPAHPPPPPPAQQQPVQCNSRRRPPRRKLMYANLRDTAATATATAAPAAAQVRHRLSPRSAKCALRGAPTGSPMRVIFRSEALTNFFPVPMMRVAFPFKASVRSQSSTNH